MDGGRQKPFRRFAKRIRSRCGVRGRKRRAAEGLHVTAEGSVSDPRRARMSNREISTGAARGDALVRTRDGCGVRGVAPQERVVSGARLQRGLGETVLE